MPKYGGNPSVGLVRRACEVCGTEFRPYRRAQTTCSRECYRQTPARRESQKQNDARPERRARQNELRRSHAPKARAAVRRSNLAKRGWTIPLYEQKLAAQDGKCRLCGAVPDPDPPAEDV